MNNKEIDKTSKTSKTSKIPKISKISKSPKNRKRRLTLKQELFLNKLAKNRYNVTKTMQEAGYSKATSLAGTQHNRLRRITSEVLGFTPESARNKILYYQDKFDNEGDNTNLTKLLALEAQASIPELRKQEIDNKNPDKVVIMYKQYKEPNKELT